MLTPMQRRRRAENLCRDGVEFAQGRSWSNQWKNHLATMNKKFKWMDIAETDQWTIEGRALFYEAARARFERNDLNRDGLDQASPPYLFVVRRLGTMAELRAEYAFLFQREGLVDDYTEDIFHAYEIEAMPDRAIRPPANAHAHLKLFWIQKRTNAEGLPWDLGDADGGTYLTDAWNGATDRRKMLFAESMLGRHTFRQWFVGHDVFQEVEPLARGSPRARPTLDILCAYAMHMDNRQNPADAAVVRRIADRARTKLDTYLATDPPFHKKMAQVTVVASYSWSMNRALYADRTTADHLAESNGWLDAISDGWYGLMPHGHGQLTDTDDAGLAWQSNLTTQDQRFTSAILAVWIREILRRARERMVPPHHQEFHLFVGQHRPNTASVAIWEVLLPVFNRFNDGPPIVRCPITGQGCKVIRRDLVDHIVDSTDEEFVAGVPQALALP